MDAPDTGEIDPPFEFGHLAARFGRALLPALRDWARDEIDRAPSR